MDKINLPPFYAGQKVVCVDATIEHVGAIYESPNPIKDKIYTIDELEFENGIWWVTIKELDCLDHFESTGFAPIQEQPMPLLTFKKIKEKELQKPEPQHLILN